MRVAQREHVDASQSAITSRVGIGPNGQGGFGLEVELRVSIPGVDTATGEKLLELAHQVCPYSNATRCNIPLKLTFHGKFLLFPSPLLLPHNFHYSQFLL